MALHLNNTLSEKAASSDCLIVIFGNEYEIQNYSARTKRSLELVGFASELLLILNCSCPDERSQKELSGSHGGVWFLQAGSWIPASDRTSKTGLALPVPSSSGRPVCAVGRSGVRTLEHSNRDADWAKWNSLLQSSNGELESNSQLDSLLPPIRSCFLDASLLPQLRLKPGNSLLLPEVLRSLALSKLTRTVHWEPIDVHFDSRLRIVQVITSLQRGGAERIAIDLHESMSKRTHQSLLISLGKPSREAFDTPSSSVDLSQAGLNRSGRIEACKQICQQFAADLLHIHLLRNADLHEISKTGIPIVATIHNTKSGWPDSLDKLSSDTVSLLIACSLAVEQEVAQETQCIATRTVWNGIKIPHESQTIEKPNPLRRNEDLHPEKLEFILTAIANPRPQKRLERLPGITAALQRVMEASGIPQRIKLLIAGEASRENELARESVDKLQQAIFESGLPSQMEVLGPVADITGLLLRSDVLISAAAHEGLSLAHLEALANNVPVVATDVGGTREIASRCSGLKLVKENATNDDFAMSILETLEAPTQCYQEVIRRDFSTSTMTSNYSRLYQRAVASQSRPVGKGVLLVINNFSTGGAQTSARRLLTGLVAKGIHVRAAVLEEARDFPTLGRQSLVSNGIDVLALPCAGSIDPLSAIQPLLTAIDCNPPETILFWNAISEYKLLIADMVWGIPLVDVSPGEMLYSSFDRYWQRPRPGLAYRDARDYGRRLSSVIVKYAGERETAESYFGTKVHVIPNGVALKDAVDLLRPKTQLTIGTVARISPQKKLEELVEAVRGIHLKIPNCRVQIVGGPERGCEPYAQQLREQAAGLPIEWMGESSNPGELMQTWDMFALISEPAGCPNAGLEAMSHGLPMVATDAGGASEQVQDGINGRLVPRGDSGKLGEAIVELAHDVALRMKYGAASHHEASTRFSEARMLADYMRVLSLQRFKV